MSELKTERNFNTRVNTIDSCITKIAKKYPHVDELKKLFLDCISDTKEVPLTVDDIEHRLKYDQKGPMVIGCHNGQRKLLLSEIQFLTYLLNFNSDIKYCIYAGAAPGHKTHLLSKLFPDIKFILIDPNEFNLFIVDKNKYHRNESHSDIVHLYNEYKSNVNLFMNKKQKDMSEKDEIEVINFIKSSKYKIYIIEDFMDDKYASLFKKLGSSAFVSDIRSNSSGNDKTSPLDIDIYWNTSMMYNWINILQPELSLLKIRIPFFNKKVDFTPFDNEFKISKKYGIDFKKDYLNFEFKMCKANLFLQAWSRPESTETRMLIKKKNINNIKYYNIKEIEEKMYYYNIIERTWGSHINENTDKSIGLCTCGDCALENLIWTNYIKLNIGYLNTVKSSINITNIITNRSLLNVHKNVIWENMSKNIDLLKIMVDKNINLKKKKFVFKNQKGQKGKN